jgi:outer membrane protein OmpA-like peptidoglycan-associated protein
MAHPTHVSAAPEATREAGPAARRSRPVEQSAEKAFRDAAADAKIALSDSGRPLPPARRREYEARLHHDFAAVRIHDDERASRSARAIHARAYTVGPHIVVDRERYDPSSPRGERTLAHELVHVIQQGATADPSSDRSIGPADSAAEREAHAIAESAGAEAPVNKSPHEAPALQPFHSGLSLVRTRPAYRSPVQQRVAPQIQRDLEEPGRLAAVNQDLFVSAPGTSGGTRRPWRDRTSTDEGTAGEIIAQATAAILKIVKDNPLSVGGQTAKNTTETNLDADALAVNRRIRARFPQITVSISDQQITDKVSVLGPSITADTGFLHEWLANRLIALSDIELFNISETDPRFVAVLDALLADKVVGPHIRTMASRIGGFQRGSGTSREIFVHEAADKDSRRVVLIHELMHFYAHTTYREWVSGTTDERFYNEGFTEWLARRVMTTAEKTGRTSYQDRVDAIDTQVADRVSEDDIARAYFAGEVFRIETKSAIARREFAGASGIREGATQREEAADSQTGPGINEEVVAGGHYRFLNLANDRAEPKPEHASYFDTIKTAHIDPDVSNVRFEGHASTVGSEAHNDRLSLLRAEAFYRMARSHGVPDARLAGAAPPAHFGETRPTLTEEDAQTRAFNRRVEMFLTPGGAPAGAASN